MFNKVAVWFVKKAWPIILKFLIAYSEEIVRKLIKVIFKAMSEREKKKAEENFNNAKESKAKADFASSKEEKEKYMFQAEFYKNQAEMKIKEIQDLARDFASIANKTVKLVAEATSNMKAEDLFELNKGNEELKLKQREKYIEIEEK